MEKITRFLPTLILCLFLGKLGVLGASIAEAVIALGLIGLFGFIETKAKDQKYQELKDLFVKKETEFDSSVKKLTEENEKIQKSLDEIKSTIVGMKMNIGIRSSTTQQPAQPVKKF